MPKTGVFIKQFSNLSPATDSDRELVDSLKAGTAYRFELTKMTARSLKHHRLLFALLQLTLDYWDDAGSLLSPAETHALNSFVKWLEKNGGNTGAINRAKEMYLSELNAKRSQRLATPTKSVDSLLLWVKDKIGYFDLVSTPSGTVRVYKSINFNSLSQESFNVLYKDAFSVCWRFVMSRNFESEAEAQRVIDNMVSMG